MTRSPERLLAAALAGCLLAAPAAAREAVPPATREAGSPAAREAFPPARPAAAPPAARTAAPPGAELSSDARMLRLGEHFYSSGQYYRAIGAYEELALFARDPALARHARLRVALAYHRGLQIDEAVQAYDRLVADRGLDPSTTGWLRLLRVLARVEGTWRAIRQVPALDLIADLQPLEEHEGAPYQILAGYHLARLHLALADRGHAREVLARNQRRCAGGERAGCQSLAALEPPLSWTPPRPKSAALGAALSAVVPGLGALYARRPVDALYYFLLTAGTGLMAWDVHDPARGPGAQQASFYILSGAAVTFYLSSVAQGWLGVKRTNEVDGWAHRQRVLQATELALPDPAGVR